jgi:hypothetical protein
MVISQEEIEQGSLHDEILHRAVQDVQEVGFVVLERVLPGAWVAKIRDAFEKARRRWKNRFWTR